ncbi:MAG: long-chain fatty acid--CoA ligase [Phycisphaera sp.]|nr:long-chain fatty acid--CoA ligase [Phycisphaera sp.]
MHPTRRLLLRHLVFRAADMAPEETVVSLPPDGGSEFSWAEIAARASRLAGGLRALGLREGDTVATLAFNDHRHLDAYLAIPCLGARLHPVNTRWSDDEIVPVLAHTRDRILMVDGGLHERVGPILERCPWIEHVISMGPGSGAASGMRDHDSIVEDSEPIDRWPDLEETAGMALCSTSGTTGGPKTVEYTHRSTCLQTMALGLTDCMRLSGRDTLLAVVPMFHAMGWCLPYAAAMLGSKLILPHRDLSPERILDLVSDHGVTTAAAVPTIWNGVLAALDTEPDRWNVSSLDRIVSGGAAPTPAMIRAFRDRHGIEVVHSWGMTEINPVGTMSPAAVTREEVAMPPDRREEHQAVAGRPLPGLSLEIEDDEGRPVPHDGSSTGRLLVSGWWVASGYLHDHPDSDRFRPDGRLDTGDVASIDDRGRMAIRDREKDLVKSGGEWISSLDLERAIADLEVVDSVAVVARPDDRWGERPVAVAVLRDGGSLRIEDIRATLASTFQSWQLPDDLIEIERMPLTSTGKIDKKALRILVRS